MEGKDQDIIDVTDKFSTGLDFGIQETMTVGSKELLDFLNNDSTQVKPEEIKPIEEKEKTPAVEKEVEGKVEESVESPDKKAKEEFNKYLLGEDEDSNESVEDQVITKTDEDSEDEVEENPLTIVARQLYESGILTKDDEEEDIDISDPEALLEKFQSEKKKGAIEIVDNFLDRFGEEYRDMFDAVFVKGVNPKEYLQSFQNIESFKDMDLTDEDNQKKVFIEFHRQLGLSEEQIKKRLEKAIEYADLEEDANTFHEKLVEKEQAKLKELELKEEAKRKAIIQADQQYDQNLRRILQDKIKEKEFDGIPVNPQIAQAAYSYLYQKKYRTPQGEELAEFDKFLLDLKKPENHELRVKVGLLALNQFDLSKVKASQNSKEKKKLFEGLDKSKVNKKVQVQQTQQNRSFFD
jgi:hypothetical protein